jgi:hypothetical protein
VDTHGTNGMEGRPKYTGDQHAINAGLPNQDNDFSALDLYGNGTPILPKVDL